ncbi:MAG: PorT family protein [Bacteroidales bacterium]|nr:PorT family protein [Bacteroidales bacterium]
MKRVLKTVLLLIVAIFFVGEAQAQRQKVLYLQKYNNEPYHFGFLLGMNFMDYSLLLNENYQNEIHPKSQYPIGQTGTSEERLQYFQILSAESYTKPGFSVGVIGDKRLGEYFNLRFSPTLSLSSKFVKYETLLYDAEFVAYESRTIESDDQLATFVEFPLHVKYRSKRYNNIGAYLIAGVNPKLYLASRKVKIDSGGHPALLQTERSDVAVEIGTGFDIYNQWFKMGVEIKFSYGLLNVLKDDILSMNYLYNSPLKEVRNKQLQLSFTFE